MEKNKILKAASWYTISNFVSKCMIYIFTPYYTRLLSESEYGQFNNFNSWRMILLVLFTFDLYSTIPVAYIDYDKKEFDRYVSSISIFSIGLPLIICFFLSMCKNYFSGITLINHIYLPIFFISIILSAPLLIFQAVQRSQVKYKLSSILTLTVSASVMCFTFFFVHIFENKLYAVIVGSQLGSIVINAIVLIIIFRKASSFSKKHLKYALTIALPLVPHIVAATLLGTSDKVMITRICGDEATAHYSLVYTCSMLVTMLVTSINSAWVPWFYSKLKEGNIESVRKMVNITVPALGFIALVFSLIAPEIIRIIGGAEYGSASPLMPPIILGCFIHYIYTLYVNIIFYEKKTIWISVGTILSCITNISLNYVCIRLFGYIAAAYTTLFSECLMLTFNYFICKKYKRNDIYENRKICIYIVAFSLLCMISLLTYDSIVVRLIYLVSILALTIMLGFRHKKEINNIYKMIR